MALLAGVSVADAAEQLYAQGFTDTDALKNVEIHQLLGALYGGDAGIDTLKNHIRFRHTDMRLATDNTCLATHKTHTLVHKQTHDNPPSTHAMTYKHILQLAHHILDEKHTIVESTFWLLCCGMLCCGKPAVGRCAVG